MRFTEEMLAEDEKRWHARDVVTELGYCGNYMQDRKNMTNLDIRFYAYIMRKAHEMLKEQQKAIKYQSDRLDELLAPQKPRVMTLDEVVAHYSLPPVFPDDFGMQEDYYEDIQPLYFEFPHDKEEPWIVHWRGHTQVARYLDEWRYSYNKKWRCWTSRPDAKVRAETPWE